MGAIGNTVAGLAGSRSQNKATKANLEAARELNAANYRIFQESRGATGNAFLPLYFGNQEKQLGQDAMTFYNAGRNLFGTPAEQLLKYKQAIGEYQPMLDASRGTLADIFNGNLTDARLEYFRPVGEARETVAATQKQGVLQGLQERLNALNADSARAGYTGTGSFGQNRLLNATIGARQQAAGLGAYANLENAMDRRGIQDQGANLKIASMDLPYQQAQQALNLEMLPMTQVQQNFSRSLAPFEFFRMGQGNFQYAPLPQVQAVPSAAQIGLTGAAAAANQLGSYYANRGAMNNAQQYQAGTYGTTLPSNFSSLGSNYQGQYMNMLQNAQGVDASLYE